MTPEARLGFLLLFLFAWAVLGIIPWTVITVASRGRGALITLPLAIGAACAAGILVPALGFRDLTGLVMSMVAAFLASAVVSVGTFQVMRRIGIVQQEAGASREELPRRRASGGEAVPTEANPVAPRPPEAGSVD